MRVQVTFDLCHDFNEANLHAAFEPLTGKWRTNNEGRVQIGDELLLLGAAKDFFLICMTAQAFFDIPNTKALCITFR